MTESIPCLAQLVHQTLVNIVLSASHLFGPKVGFVVAIYHLNGESFRAALGAMVKLLTTIKTPITRSAQAKPNN